MSRQLELVEQRIWPDGPDGPWPEPTELDEAGAPNDEPTAPLKGVHMRLHPTELDRAGYVGVRKNLIAIERGWSRHGKRTDRLLDDNARGAIGEYVVSKWANLAWCGRLDRPDHFDVGRYQVRTSRRLDGDLIVKPKDDPTCPGILVVGDLEDWWIVGWIMNGYAQQQKHWWKPRGRNVTAPGYFVPQAALHDMDQLHKRLWLDRLPPDVADTAAKTLEFALAKVGVDDEGAAALLANLPLDADALEKLRDRFAKAAVRNRTQAPDLDLEPDPMRPV